MGSAIALPQDIGSLKPSGIDTLLAFVGMLPPKRSTNQLSGSTEELLKNISAIISDLLLRSLEQPTLAEFVATRNEVFPAYYRTLHAISDLARVVLPERALERLVDDSLSELEAHLQDQGIEKFGSAIQEQALFTIWLFRRISKLVRRLNTAAPTQNQKEADEKLATEFSIAAAWAQFHLECLSIALTGSKRIYPEALPEILDALKAAVNAYGLARQGLDLRLPQQEPLLDHYEWDQEDQELLDSSVADLGPEAE